MGRGSSSEQAESSDSRRDRCSGGGDHVYGVVLVGPVEVEKAAVALGSAAEEREPRRFVEL